MRIHELKVNKKKTRKRIGRGGRRGTYSGRGLKGQKARSGAKVDPLFAGGRSSSLIAKLKKVRGFKSLHPKKNVVTLDVLERKFKDNDLIDIKNLLEKNIIRRKNITSGVKILNSGEIKKKLTISSEIILSKSAEEAIKKAGGEIEKKKEEVKEKKKVITKKESKKVEDKKSK